eukprot:gene28309-50142_t
MYFEPETRVPGVIESIGLGASQSWDIATTSLSGLWHVVAGKISSCAISGPIGMAEVMGDAARSGPEVFLGMLAALSLALALAVSLAVRRQLLAQVSVIGQAAASLASGNMTVPARDYGSDELSDTARALDASILGLNGTLRTILDSARALDLASRRMVGLERAESPCAVMQVDHLPQGAPAQVQVAAQAAHSLQLQALELARAVAEFKLEPACKGAYGRPKLRLAADRGQLQEDDALADRRAAAEQVTVAVDVVG